MEPRRRSGVDGSDPEFQLYLLQSSLQRPVDLRLRGDIAGQSGHQLSDRCDDNYKNRDRSGPEEQAVGRALLPKGFLLFRSGEQLRRCAAVAQATPKLQ